MCPIGAHSGAQSGAHPIMFIKMNKIELKDLDEIIYHDETARVYKHNHHHYLHPKHQCPQPQYQYHHL